MIRKICPVCEQTMGRFNYCKNCRQFVKTPYVRDVTYYLNESHSKEETSCDYHGIPKARTRAETGNGAAPLPRDQTVSPIGAAIAGKREAERFCMWFLESFFWRRSWYLPGYGS